MDTSSPTPPKDSSVGPLAGIIIIVALLAVGGIYFFVMQQTANEQEAEGEAQASANGGNLVISPNAI